MTSLGGLCIQGAGLASAIAPASLLRRYRARPWTAGESPPALEGRRYAGPHQGLMLAAEGGHERTYQPSMPGQPVDERAAMPEAGLAGRFDAVPGIIDIDFPGGEHFLVSAYAGPDGPLPSQPGAVWLDSHIEPLVLLHINSNIGTLIIHIISVIVMLACRNRQIGTYSAKNPAPTKVAWQAHRNRADCQQVVRTSLIAPETRPCTNNSMRPPVSARPLASAALREPAEQPTRHRKKPGSAGRLQAGLMA